MSDAHTRTVGCLVALLLLTVYAITYSGRIDSGDELRIMDGITSAAHFGDWNRDESLWLGVSDAISPSQPLPLIALPDDERSVAFLALPLFALAHLIPSLGLLHIVWLYNIFVTVATALVVYTYAHVTTRHTLTAALTALLFGTGTLAWAYSRTLFREPSVMFLLSVCVLCVTLWHQRQDNTRWLWLILAIASVALAVWVKSGAAFAIPALIVLAIPVPYTFTTLRWQRVSLVCLGLVGVVVLAIAWMPQSADFVRSLLQRIVPVRLLPTASYAQIAFHTYLFSIGASVWATSPVLLLVAGGIIQLLRTGRQRMVWVVVLAVMGYAFGHAFLTGQHWFGGASLPPRFLLPVLPVVMTLVVPVLHWAVRHRTVWGFAIVAISGLSVIMQGVFAISFMGGYATTLPPESNGLSEWGGGLNLIAYHRFLKLPETWATLGLDLAWVRVPLQPILWANLALLIALSVIMIGVLRGWRRTRPFIVVGFVLLIGINSVGLTWLNQSDPIVSANSAGLDRAYAILEAESRANDVLILPYETFAPYFLNHNRLTTLRPLGLPKQAGEAISPRIPAEVSSNSTGDLLTWFTMRALDHLWRFHDRAWLLTNMNPYETWMTRVIERYMVERYYLVREVPTDDIQVRLLEFALNPYPMTQSFANPDVATDVRFGESLRLEGFSLANGTTLSAGDVLPINLYWRTAQPLNDDLVVSVFVAAPDGTIIAQGADSPPQAGFAPTTLWQVNLRMEDRRAIRLPVALAAREYQLWVVVYRFVDGQPQRLPVTAGVQRDGTIAILPVTLTIP